MPAEINRFVIDLAPKLFGGARGRNTHLQRFGARRRRADLKVRSYDKGYEFVGADLQVRPHE